MRLTLFLIGLTVMAAFGSSSVNAQAISKTMANKYFENCLAAPSPNMSAETHEYLCACTSAQMMDNMTVKDVKTMTEQTQAGRFAMNKMLVQVYAPCMNYPAKELYYKNCITDPKTATLSKNPEKTCTCLSNSVANYLSNQGPAIFSEILNRNPNAVDPMAALADDPKFQKFTKSKLLSCVM